MKIKTTDIIGIIGGGTGGDAPPQQRSLVRQNNSQNITANTETILGFTDQDSVQNVGEFWDSIDPSQFKIPVGIETVILSLTFAADAAGSPQDFSVSIKKNGATVATDRASVTEYGAISISIILDVAEDDILIPYVWSSGGFTTDPEQTSFGIVDITNGGSGQVAIYAQNAENSAIAASSSATSASASATAAGGSATIAQNASISASSSALSADDAKNEAINSADAAAGSASTASSFATGAGAFATAANNAAITAQSAATAAGTSKDNAQNSAIAAATSASTASTHATNASSSATAAQNSAISASSSANAADISKTGAQNSAIAAASSASTASTKATEAGNSASAASSSAVAAASSATNASNSKDLAQSSATAASNSANSAQTYATNASNSATAANSSALTASSHATNAGTSAGNAQNSATAAATSASNASTHATNASNSATSAMSASLTAQANAYPRGITPNGQYDAGLASWYLNNTEDATNAVFQSSFQSASNVATSIAGVRTDIHSAKFSVDTTRKYRLRARVYSSGQSGITYIGVMCLDNNGATISPNLGVVYWSSGVVFANGWTDVVSDVITGESAASLWGSGFRTGTKLVRVFAYLNYSTASAQIMGLDYLYLEDVTESEKAAASASAAFTSASNASASATAAGNSATAASGHAISASTSAGTASTKASEAATSASNAQGYSNTASSQATLAANSASAASGSASAASTSASNASTYATNASNSASSASGHANTASIKAGEASSSALAASGSASAASISASSAQNYSVLAASVGTGYLNKNAGFDDYPSASVGAVPTGWTYDMMSIANGYRVADQLGGYAYCLPAAASASAYTAVDMSGFNLVQSQGYYVIEADIILNSGTLTGAGVLLRPQNSSGSTSQDIMMVFNSTPDQTGTAPGAGVAGRSYQFRKLVQVTLANAYGFRLWAMSHWSSLGSITTANNITWLTCGVRPAYPSEIRDQTVLSPLQATVTTLSNTVATYDSRLASYLTRVSAGSGSAELSMVAQDSGGNPTSNITLKAEKIKLGSVSAPVLEISGGKAVFTGELNVGGTSGARVNITQNLIRVYDASGVLRVRIGVW